MDDAGSDLWDVTTVRVLMTSLRNDVARSVRDALEELVTAEKGEKEGVESENGVGTKTDEDSTSSSAGIDLQDWKIQLFFDTIYLQHALSAHNHPSERSELVKVVNMVRQALQSDEVAQSVEKTAAEYWKRTRLLFGLLVVDRS